MLVVEDHTLEGAVTIGGCADAQVIEAAQDVARSGRPQLLRVELGEEDALEIGLTCAGVLRVFVEPAEAFRSALTDIESLLGARATFALLTVTQSSLPEKPGDPLPIYADLPDPRGFQVSWQQRVDLVVREHRQSVLARLRRSKLWRPRIRVRICDACTPKKPPRIRYRSYETAYSVCFADRVSGGDTGRKARAVDDALIPDDLIRTYRKRESSKARPGR
jgi:xanthine/CO dehydrogenase XdhC/CoxF family maturation factor